MNPTIKRLTSPIAAVFGLAVFAALMLFTGGGSTKTVQAQTPDPTPGAVTFFKECVGPLDQDFTVVLDYTFTGADAGTASNDLDFSFGIACDQTVVLDDTVPAFADVLEFLDLSDLDTAVVDIIEPDLPEDTTAAFSGDCEGGSADILATAEAFTTTGLVCVITNTLDEPGSIVVTKLCPSGDGGASFAITIEGMAPVAVPCGGSVLADDLEPGDYDVSEAITGTNATNFVTMIACIDADGSSTTPGTTATITLDFGTDATCIVTNSLVLPSPTPAPTQLSGINNLLNNNNANNNTSVNTNANTLSQSNTQTQANNNDQKTNVNANPTQNVNVGGAKVDVSTAKGVEAGPGVKVGPVSPVGETSAPQVITTTPIRPPSTGDAGLVGQDSSNSGRLLLAGLAIAAGALITASQFRRSRS